jgi:hypothetical protein
MEFVQILFILHKLESIVMEAKLAQTYLLRLLPTKLVQLD